MPKGIPKNLEPFDEKLKDKVIRSAAKLAQRKSRPKTEADNMELSPKQEKYRNRIHNALRYGLEMNEQQFLNAVQKKLQHMVSDSLNDLHDSIERIPPQNKAYAVGLLIDKLMTVSGRPTNITASANVKLGASDMSPDKVRSILKGAKEAAESIPPQASEDKVIEVNPSEDKR